MESTLYAAHFQEQLAGRRLSKQRRVDGLRSLLEIQSRNSSVMPLLLLLLQHADALVCSGVVSETGQRALAGKTIDADTGLSLCRDHDVLVRREVAHAIGKLPYPQNLRKEIDGCPARLSRDYDGPVR